MARAETGGGRATTSPAAGEGRRTAPTGAAVVERPGTGRLCVTGAARRDYLHRVSTQACRDLTPPGGVRAALLERTGKLLSVFTVHAFPDHLLLLVPPGLATVTTERLRGSIFRDDVQIRDRSAEMIQLTLLGPEAAAAAASLAGEAARSLAPYRWLPIPGIQGAWVVAGTPMPGPAYHLVAELASEKTLRQRLLSPVDGPAVVEVGEEAYQTARVLAGLPEPEGEIDGETGILDLGLDDALDRGKGCFPGQEAVAKTLTYGGVKRRLVGLRPAEGGMPPPGAPLEDPEGEVVGRVTSVAGGAGLALVRRAQAEPGTRLRSGGVPVRVTGLPIPEDQG